MGMHLRTWGRGMGERGQGFGGTDREGRVLKKGVQVERHPCNIRGRLKGWKAREEGDALEGGRARLWGNRQRGMGSEKGFQVERGKGKSMEGVGKGHL